MGPRTLPWGSPVLTGKGEEQGSIVSHTSTRGEDVSHPRVELTLDSTSRQFGEQGRMPDCTKSLRYVQRNGPDLISDIEGLQHCWESRSSNVQGKSLTGPESKLMI